MSDTAPIKTKSKDRIKCYTENWPVHQVVPTQLKLSYIFFNKAH